MRTLQRRRPQLPAKFMCKNGRRRTLEKDNQRGYGFGVGAFQTVLQLHKKLDATGASAKNPNVALLLVTDGSAEPHYVLAKHHLQNTTRWWRIMGFLPLLCVLAWLSSPKPAGATSKTKSLPAFSTVQVNLPFNIKISPGSSCSLKLEASQQVIDAVDSSVSNSVLYLGTHGDFKTQQPIYATVFLPAGSLQQILVQSPVNAVAVDSGFHVQSFSANVAGTSTLYVKSLVAKKVTVTSTG